MKSSKPFAIVGAAESDLGKVPGMTSLDLQAQAAARALRDAGLALRTWTGVCPCRRQVRRPAAGRIPGHPSALRRFDQRRRHVQRHARAPRDGGDPGGHVRGGVGGLRQHPAVGRLAQGRRRARGHAHAARAIHHPYGQLSPIGYYAMVAQLHMQRYGTTHRDLAEVAVAARRWAQLNPHAYRREDTSIDEVMASRLIADPLRQRDCCLVTDAGGAFILTTAERARSLRRPPVHVLGIAESFRITTRRSILPTGSTPTWRRRRTRRWRWPASRARTSTWCRSMTTSPSA